MENETTYQYFFRKRSHSSYGKVIKRWKMYYRLAGDTYQYYKPKHGWTTSNVYSNRYIGRKPILYPTMMEQIMLEML